MMRRGKRKRRKRRRRRRRKRRRRKCARYWQDAQIAHGREQE